MATYGRNVEFRVPPQSGQRGGRYVLASDADLPIGVPVTAADGATPDASLTNALPVDLAAAGTAPTKGLSGILVYEHIDMHYLDPAYYSASDRDTAPTGKMVQVVSGDMVKVVFRNTEDRTFLQTRDYTGRTMVAPADLTGLAVGDMLTPGVGTDDGGYWAETADAALAWLIVENIDTARGEVECRLAF